MRPSRTLVRVVLFTAMCLVFMFVLVTVFGQFRFDVAQRLQRGVHERVGPQGRQLRPHRRRRGRQGQRPDPAQGRHRHRRLRHRQGPDAHRGHQGGGALREPDRRPLSVPRRRARLGAQTATGPDDSAGADVTRARRRCADRRLPAAVPRAGSRPGQCAVRRTAEGVPGPGRHHLVGAGPDLGADNDAGRPRPAHRRGHHQPEHGAGHLRHARRPVLRRPGQAVPTRRRAWPTAGPTSPTGWPTSTPRRDRSPTC